MLCYFCGNSYVVSGNPLLIYRVAQDKTPILVNLTTDAWVFALRQIGEEEDMMAQEDEDAMENDEEDEDGADEGRKDDSHEDHGENEVVLST